MNNIAPEHVYSWEHNAYTCKQTPTLLPDGGSGGGAGEVACMRVEALPAIISAPFTLPAPLSLTSSIQIPPCDVSNPSGFIGVVPASQSK